MVRPRGVSTLFKTEDRAHAFSPDFVVAVLVRVRLAPRGLSGEGHRGPNFRVQLKGSAAKFVCDSPLEEAGLELFEQVGGDVADLAPGDPVVISFPWCSEWSGQSFDERCADPDRSDSADC